MKFITRPLVCLTVSLAISACATGPKIAEEPVSAPMKPMQNISREVGFTLHFRKSDTGEEGSWYCQNYCADGNLRHLQSALLRNR